MLDGFRHQINLPIRYRDLDTLGHVNNVVYLTYIEQARITYFNDLDLWDGSPSEAGLILARNVIDYKHPLSLTDQAVDVWTRIGRLGGKSFDMMHVLTIEKDDEAQIVAEATITMVAFNYITQSAITLPDDWRKAIIDYEPNLDPQ